MRSRVSENRARLGNRGSHGSRRRQSQAEVLRLAGRTEDADLDVREAIRAAEQNGNLVGARLGRDALAAGVDRPAASST
jgi:hypothetical protein